jgi:hypothetical protein
MYLPHWFWRVRFRTADGGGETLVVAPHRAAAKQSVTAAIRTITAYESAEPGERVPSAMAAQRFDGYYPGVRRTLSAGRSAVRELRR